MNHWAIPFIDQPPDFWHDLHQQWGDQIEEVYFPMPGDGLGSGRPRQPDQFVDAFLRDAPVSKAVLINPIVLPVAAARIGPPICDALAELHDKFGVNRVTVSDLTLAHLIRERLPQYRITASVLMGIATPQQVAMLDGAVDVIVPDTRLVRDLSGLHRLRRAFGGQLRLMVNEGCLPGCPYRTQHFYEMGYCETYPESLCAPLLAEKPWLRLTGAWVPPQYLHFYDGVYDTLKLAGRVTLQQPERYRTVLGAYITREALPPAELGGGPASLTAPLAVSAAFFEHLLHCAKDCSTCQMCHEYFESGGNHDG